MTALASIVEGCKLDPLLLSTIEDAGLNASAPPQQRWLDGWLLRFSPGKARRARCVNAVAEGRLPWQAKLAQVEAIYATFDMPLAFRITPFTRPESLDAALASAGHAASDLTLVMVRPFDDPVTPVAHRDRPSAATAACDLESSLDPAPQGLFWRRLEAESFAAAIGELRGSPTAQIEAHAERLRHVPVEARRMALVREADGLVQACGQAIDEGGLMGLYDIHTRPSIRSRGLATQLCQALMTAPSQAAFTHVYLQVDRLNKAAQSVYRKLGFEPAYHYHYRDIHPRGLTL